MAKMMAALPESSVTGVRREREVTMSLSSNDCSLEIVRLVVDQAPDGIIFADRQGMIQVWNNAAADVLPGMSLEGGET
jgi:PAS domain-containing protein